MGHVCKLQGGGKKTWQERPIHGNMWRVVQRKLNRYQKTLQQWVKKTVHSMAKIVRQKTKDLVEIQQKDGPTYVDGIKHLQDELHVLMEQDDLKWKQRAKENWLKHGDRNTKYFHACANQRKKCNLISQILDENGRFCTSNGGITSAFIHYYHNLFTIAELDNIGDCIHAIKNNVSP
jgi:hypothetical protein